MKKIKKALSIAVTSITNGNTVTANGSAVTKTKR